jgi:hypothetical protein
VKIGAPVHVALSGPNSVKVMVPVGLTPPASVAVSVIVPPCVTSDDAWVVIVGVAAVTTDVSLGSLHGVTTAV